MTQAPNLKNQKFKLKKNYETKLRPLLLKRKIWTIGLKLYFYDQLFILNLCDLTRKPLAFKF